ncbi:HAD family hydrolase [Streptomyces sp. SP18CS02]|uniref:HAD family hydrolase n=1 Tax=Streptomyces sp. SP18CS02 TaxID=3002531 RepID=UPI002E7A0DFE|nr:HAD family hydrolase [Streptomyces sp. SP18CS02]MEE1752043.1 HAD family hydrolase [Streptomyces sp. SP18CS02]
MSTAVLFDLDGTLLDTPNAIVRVLAEVVTGSGRPLPPEAELRATVGRPLAACFSALLRLPEDHPEVGQATERFREVFRTSVVPGARSMIFPGVPALLELLRERGHRIAIVTSKIRPSAEELLLHAGLLDRFDAVVCHGMAPRGKPHPDLALLAAGHLGTEPASCVVVGDAVDDMRMARAAGMAALGVTYGVATEEQLTADGAHRVTGSVDGLSRILSGLAGPEELSVLRATPVPRDRRPGERLHVP